MSHTIRRAVAFGVLAFALMMSALPGLADAGPRSGGGKAPSFVVKCTNVTVNGQAKSVVRAEWQGKIVSITGEFSPVSGSAYSKTVKVNLQSAHEWSEVPLASAKVKFLDRVNNVVQSRSASCS